MVPTRWGISAAGSAAKWGAVPILAKSSGTVLAVTVPLLLLSIVEQLPSLALATTQVRTMLAIGRRHRRRVEHRRWHESRQRPEVELRHRRRDSPHHSACIVA